MLSNAFRLIVVCILANALMSTNLLLTDSYGEDNSLHSDKKKIVRIRSGGELNANASRSAAELTTVPANMILVIETISVNIRIPNTPSIPEVARFVIVTGSAFPPGSGSPLIDVPVTRMAIDPAGNFVNYVALAHMKAYADELVQYSIDLSKPSSGFFDVSLFGYLIPQK